LNSIKNYLDGRDNEILEDIRLLVEKESPTLEKSLVDECGEEIKKLFKNYLNLEPKVIEDETYGNHLLFEFGNLDSDEQMLISGHFDTVWDKGELPFIIDENKAYGPGTIDMKGGLVIAIWALRAIKDLSLDLNKRIVFLCNSDHEGVASPHSRKYIEEQALKSEVVLVPEAAVAHTNALKTERKGILRYKITTHGKAAHSGNNPEDGINAIVEMANHIKTLDKLNENKLGTTVNIGKINGGTGVNVIADKAVINVDIRVKTMDEAHRIKSIVESLTPIKDGIKLDIEGGIVRPSMEKTEKTDEIFNIVKRLGDEIGYEVKEASVGGGSDGSFAAALGIPTIDGLGAAGVGPHSREEHILIDHLAIKSTLLSNLIIELDKK